MDINDTLDYAEVKYAIFHKILNQCRDQSSMVPVCWDSGRCLKSCRSVWRPFMVSGRLQKPRQRSKLERSSSWSSFSKSWILSFAPGSRNATQRLLKKQQIWLKLSSTPLGTVNLLVLEQGTRDIVSSPQIQLNLSLVNHRWPEVAWNLLLEQWVDQKECQQLRGSTSNISKVGGWGSERSAHNTSSSVKDFYKAGRKP